MDAIRMLKLAPTTLVVYLTLLEGHYSTSNPYHNSTHAADVTQSANVLLRRPALRVLYIVYIPLNDAVWSSNFLAYKNHRLRRC